MAVGVTSDKLVIRPSKISPDRHPRGYSGAEPACFWTVLPAGDQAVATHPQLEGPEILSPFERRRLPAYRLSLSRQHRRLGPHPDPLARPAARGDLDSRRESVAVDAAAQAHHLQP